MHSRRCKNFLSAVSSIGLTGYMLEFHRQLARQKQQQAFSCTKLWDREERKHKLTLTVMIYLPVKIRKAVLLDQLAYLLEDKRLRPRSVSCSNWSDDIAAVARPALFGQLNSL